MNAVQIGSYNSKAEPVAQALQAMNTMNQKGWKTIRRYYSQLGADNSKPTQTVNPRNVDDRRFFANFATEDPGHSPMPLVAMICSLDARDTSGDLQALRGELLEATAVPDYSTWSLDRLRQAIHDLTREQTTDKGVKYRAPKTTVTFKESVQLYAMIVAFLAKDTKWVDWRENIEKLGYSLPPAPEIVDFSNRLRQQLPMTIPPGATRGMLLYRPGWDIAQPRSKEEFEERADVVLIKRAGATFHVEQFPIYLTVDQKDWSPSWILPQDETKDTTLMARKIEELWTRFDGPFLWYKNDQLNGEVTYKATVKFQKDEIVIEAERFVPQRGRVARTARDPLYDPLNMKRFEAGMEQPEDPLTVDYPTPEWQEMWRQSTRNINETCYRPGDRQLFSYRVGDNSWTNSVFPRSDAGPAILRPTQPVSVPSSGIVARYSSADANQPDDVQLLTAEQKATVGIAVGLMNLCLANVGGSELDALRTALPRDIGNVTPIYFYSLRNGTSVRRSPNAMVVVLSEGYYSGYASAFNRLLWVLEKPIADDPGKVAVINHSISDFLKNKCPKDATTASDPALNAWSELLQTDAVDQLFNASALPAAIEPPHAAPR